MTNTNIVSVWQALLKEGDEGARAEASKYINESAARILKSLMEDDTETPDISSEETGISTASGENIVTAVYSDPDGDCNFDDDIISASGKDDYDASGWSNGKRIVTFIFDDKDSASQAASTISDLTDTVDGLSVTSSDSSDEGESVEDTTDEVSVDDGGDVDSEETEVTETEETGGEITVSFPSDGDSTVVDDLAALGLDVISSDIDDSGNRVVKISSGDLSSSDIIPVIKDALRGAGVSDYDISSEEDSVEGPVSVEMDDDGVVGEDGEVAVPDQSVEQEETVGTTLDSILADFENLKSELAAAGIDLSSDSSVDSEGTEDLTDLEESFLGYEDVSIPKNKDLNDGKSPIISTPTKDRLKPASPIKSPAGQLTGDGTKQETSPSVKSLPSTKNTVKGNVEKTYTKVSKEGDSSAKINSKEGFGEEGKNSIID